MVCDQGRPKDKPYLLHLANENARTLSLLH